MPRLAAYTSAGAPRRPDQVSHDQDEISWRDTNRREKQNPAALVDSLEVGLSSYRLSLNTDTQVRSSKLQHVSSSDVHQGIKELMTVPSGVQCPVALGALAQILGIRPCPSPYLVDIEGNPWTEHILTIVDALLVLTSSPPDKQAREEALVASLCRYTHHHVLRAIWYALVFLDLGTCANSSRFGSVRRLLDITEFELLKAKWRYERRSTGRLENEIWLARFVRAREFRARMECQRDTISLGSLWAIMKGLEGGRTARIPRDDHMRWSKRKRSSSTEVVSRDRPASKSPIDSTTRSGSTSDSSSGSTAVRTWISGSQRPHQARRRSSRLGLVSASGRRVLSSDEESTSSEGGQGKEI